MRIAKLYPALFETKIGICSALYLLSFLTYLIFYRPTPHILENLALALVLVFVAFKSPTIRAIVLFCCAVVILASIAPHYFTVANHAFLLSYIGLALSASYLADDPVQTFRHHARVLLTLLMGVALIQKLASPYFLSGDLLGERFTSGAAFPPSYHWVFGIDRTAAQFQEIAGELRTAALERGAMAFELERNNAIYLISIVGTMVALTWQALIEFTCLSFKRFEGAFHILVISFVIYVAVMTYENVFLSLNCILALGAATQYEKFLTPLYSSIAIVLIGTYYLI